jgi:genome maintenance exonuclease 1
MIVNKTFHHVECPLWEELTSETTPEGRYYQTPDGETYPSVTTVTGWKMKQFFADWRHRNPDESQRVLRRGNQLHDTIEKYLYNDESYLDGTDEDIPKLFHQMSENLGRIDNITGLEQPLWSHTMKLAGRVDCIAEFDGKLSVIDFKGSTKLKKETDIKNYFLQATAYAIMFQERTKTPIEQIVILISCDTGESQVFVANPMDYVPQLKKCLEEYYESPQGNTSG